MADAPNPSSTVLQSPVDVIGKDNTDFSARMMEAFQKVSPDPSQAQQAPIQRQQQAPQPPEKPDAPQQQQDQPKPDAIEEDVEVEDRQPADPDPEKQAKAEKARARWQDLKRIEKEHQELQRKWKEEAEPVLQTWDEQRRSAAEKALQFEAAFNNRQQPEYVENITKPYLEREEYIGQLADYAGVDQRAIMSALQEPNEFKREAAINAILDSSSVEIAPGTRAQAALTIKEMRGLIAKGQESDQKAMQLREAYARQDAEKQTKAQQERLNTFKRAAQETAAEVFEKQFPELMKDPDVARAIKEVEPTENPKELSFNAQAAAALVHVHKELTKIRSERDELKKTLAARTKASPSTTTGAPPQNGSTAKWDPKNPDVYGGKTFEQRAMEAANRR